MAVKLLAVEAINLLYTAKVYAMIAQQVVIPITGRTNNGSKPYSRRHRQ
jgi:hypothetical protein